MVYTLPPALAVHEIYRDIFGPPMLTPGTDAITSVVVLQRTVTFFLKSKQQIFYEKGLKPNKNSVSLRQQFKGLKSVSKSSRLPVMKNAEITTLRNDFTVPAIEKFLCHLKTLPLEESETILSNLQCKELAKILKAMGKPAYLGKKKERQVKSLLEAIKKR